MPIAPTYPGIYIEELPSSAHTIIPAPTSITVFVGYTHPFKTAAFDTAVEIFGFTDFEREFGGFFTSGVIDTSLPKAVYEFFLNGGSDAWVVGLQASYWDTSAPPPVDKGVIVPATRPLSGIAFTAREPVDAVKLYVTINNLKQTTLPNDTADIAVTYGSRAETFRGVSLDSTSNNYIEKRLGTAANPVSQLVTVAAPYPAAFALITQQEVQYPAGPPSPTSPDPNWSGWSSTDYIAAFDEDQSLDKVAIFNLLVLPGVSDVGVWSDALAFCERKRAFAILDPPFNASADATGPPPMIADVMENSVPKSTNGALYFPYLTSPNPATGVNEPVAPGGFVAGIYARTDTNRGVWKAPAGYEAIVNNTVGVVPTGRMTDARQGTLNPKGVNCLRTFPGIGTVVFGARTLVTENTAFQQWWYVPVRRMALFIEQSLYFSLGWAVFEPNDDPLWVALRTTVQKFMLSLFNQGAFQGSTPSAAFQVKCDGTTTTQDDIDRGIVNIIVAFAPLKPAEFVVVKIALLAGQTTS
jgi:uncharacterized protein